MADYGKLADEILVSLLQTGDQRAFTEIYDRYKGVLYVHAYRMLKDHDASEDVVQDVFLTLWQGHTNLEIRQALHSYLYIAVRNRIFKLFARQRVSDRYLDSLAQFQPSADSPADEQLLLHELSQLIEAGIETLPPKMKEVFLLSRAGTYSYREIAEQLNVSEKTVRNQVYNAVQQLKSKINLLVLWLF